MEPEANSQVTPSTGRRSSRVIVSIPLLISGKGEDGTRFEGNAEAVVVNKHGGKIRTAEKLSSGMQIRIAIISPYRFQMARVVREEAQGEFSVELQEAENLWGVYFPPDDWGPDLSEAITESAQQATIAAPEKTRTEPETASTSICGPATPSADVIEKTIAQDTPDTLLPITLSRRGSDGVIRGMSIVRMPFQERCLLFPVDEGHASIGIRQLVDPGTRVRIIFLPSERVESAVVARISTVRIEGKWVLQLKFGTAVNVVE